MKTLICLMIVCCLFSCGIGNTEKKMKGNKINDNVGVMNDSCTNSVFYITMSRYIKETKGHFGDLKMYYTIYLFEKGNTSYFTIWSFNCHPDFLELYNPNIDFEFANMQIDNEVVYLVTKKDDTALSFICSCRETFSYERIEIEDTFNYDGSWHIETYEYYLEDNNFVVKKLNSPIVDFLGDVPKEFY